MVMERSGDCRGLGASHISMFVYEWEVLVNSVIIVTCGLHPVGNISR